jgi:hypothetical protein
MGGQKDKNLLYLSDVVQEWLLISRKKIDTTCCIGRNGIWSVAKNGCRPNLKIAMAGAKILKK